MAQILEPEIPLVFGLDAAPDARSDPRPDTRPDSPLEIDAWDALPPRPSAPQVRGEMPKPTGQVDADPETFPLEQSLWEEILRRDRHVEVVGEPVRVRSSFVNGYQSLPVQFHEV